MHFLRAGFIEELDRFAQLRAADDGVVDEHQLLAFDELRNRNLLHLGDLIAHLLIGGREGTRPGRGVLDERTGKGLVALVRVADGVRHAAVRHARDVIDVRHAALRGFARGHDLAVAHAHELDVLTLVVGVGIAVIRPEERADAHVRAGGGEGFAGIGRQADDFLGAQLVMVGVAELVIGEGLEGDAHGVFLFADEHRQAAQLVARGDDLALVGEDKQRHRAVDHFLRVQDAGDEVVLLVDERSDELGRVDLARAHGHELMAVVGEVLRDERLAVVDDADGGKGVKSQMGTHEQGLRIGVADAADAAAAVEFVQVLFKLGAERGIFDRVNLPLEAVLFVMDQHAAAAGTQMRVIVDAKEYVQNDVLFGDGAKETTH